eukprot:8503066-Pyramimonas_sp.AAC.1
MSGRCVGHARCSRALAVVVCMNASRHACNDVCVVHRSCCPCQFHICVSLWIPRMSSVCIPVFAETCAIVCIGAM